MCKSSKKRRVSMLKVRELLRLFHQEQLSQRKIAISLRVSRDTIARLLGKAQELGLSWPLPPDINDQQLQDMFKKKHKPRFPVPNLKYVWKESLKKGVTLELLWHEYREEYSVGYSYQRFCTLLRRFRKKLHPVMRFEHKAGEKVFVDWVGGPLPKYIDPETGEIREAQVFVATVGASSYTYCQAFVDQKTPSWIAAHEEAFEFFGGVTVYSVPDNTKTAVTKPYYYDPDYNKTYLDFAHHYDFIILPARVRKARDKAKVEAGVKYVEQHVLAPFRNKTFYGLEALNEALSERLEKSNREPMKILEQSRLELFEELEQHTFKPLPTRPFEFGDWKEFKVAPDYHLDIGRHFYSVPYTLIGETVSVKITASLIHVYHNNDHLLTHIRSYRKGGYTTIDEHMPPAHLQYRQRLNPQKILSWAYSVGPETTALLKGMFVKHKFPEHCYRSWMGMKSLAKRFGNDKLEEAVGILRPSRSRVSYRQLKRVIELNLQEREPVIAGTAKALKNDNIRGAQYYQ